MVLYISAEGTINKCLYIRGEYRQLYTSAHIDYICKIQYVAHIGNPFHTIYKQSIFCSRTKANCLQYCPAMSLN